MEDNHHHGTGVRLRIIELFEQLADDVVASASDPAVELLVQRFREVDKEILAAFGEHNDPLQEAAEALIQRQERRLEAVEVKSTKLRVEIEAVIAGNPLAEDTERDPSL